MKNKSVAIICGDPKSTFNEILIKTLKNNFLKNTNFPIIIISSEKIFRKELNKFKTKISLKKFDNSKNLNKKKVYIIDIPLDDKNLTLNKKNFYIKKSFEVGLNLIKEKRSFALMTAMWMQIVIGKFHGQSFLKADLLIFKRIQRWLRNERRR